MRNGKPFVLFADDHEDSRMMMVVAAQLRGWEAVGASTAREMMDLVNQYCSGGESCFDTIVADIQFHNADNGPRMSGITAIEAIRKRFPNIPVLYFSGYISAMNKGLIRAQGAEFMQKPGAISDLLERVEYIMYWAGPLHYIGPERRRTSVNRTQHYRRRTDMPVHAPKVVELALSAARVAAIGDGPHQKGGE